jgi:excisionase family DNA binding protein
MNAPREQQDNAAPIPLPELALTVEEAARVLRIGRTTMYGLVMTGEVESVTIGRLRRVPAECLTEYLRRRRADARQANPAA